ncbi:DMT family transporter [Nonomuraea sp. NPDC050663]|uniref:DMT family transporter n=1 Tax=Nonomuraea sp. NPDC050663 TaxID=3364370 RepID=UPI0037AB2F9C
MRLTTGLLAMAAGVLLTLMTLSNAVLAQHTGAVFASWAAHGIGAVVALLLMLVTPRAATPEGRTPLWYYLGGIPGALVVVLSAVAVNSELALSGTIALMLTGQVIFGAVSDHLGLLDTPKRPITGTDLAVAGCVLSGAVLIVLGA